MKAVIDKIFEAEREAEEALAASRLQTQTIASEAKTILMRVNEEARVSILKEKEALLQQAQSAASAKSRQTIDAAKASAKDILQEKAPQLLPIAGKIFDEIIKA